MDTVTVDTERFVHASAETVRRTVQSALEDMSFTIDKSQGGQVEGHRGSALRGHDQRPVRISVSVMDHGNETRVHLHLADADPLSSNPQVLCPAYQPLFYSTLGDLDAWLLAVDPSLTVMAPPALEVHTGGPSYVRSKMANLASHLPGSYGKSTAKALYPELSLWLVAPDASALLEPDTVQMLLTVMSMATAEATTLPPAHARRVEDLYIGMQRAVQTGRPPYARLDVSEVDRRALDFLYRQALIRQSLPVREVRQCRDCGYEKVTNPDYRKQLQHSQTMQQLGGLVGLSVGTGGANVFAVAGRLFNLNALRSKAIPCAKCEGTDADVTLATLCPKCRQLRKEPLLRICPNKACGYNFVQRASGSMWNASADVSSVDGQQPAVLPAAGVTAETAPAEEPLPPPGWYDDPSGRHELRWFDGDWTEWAADDGVTTCDPLT